MRYLTPLSLLAIALLLGVNGCYYDVEEELYPSGCDTANMSFSAHVLPILNDNCNACHASSAALGGIVLDTYTEVKKQVDNGKLLGSIRHEAGFSPMPQGQPQIANCPIDRIAAWIQAGAPNN